MYWDQSQRSWKEGGKGELGMKLLTGHVFAHWIVFNLVNTCCNEFILTVCQCCISKDWCMQKH
jgi:hypothetical protein